MNASAPSQFRSNYEAMRITARHGHKVYHPVTGAELRDQEVKELTAEFAVHRGEVNVINDEGDVVETRGDVAGFFYDLDVDAEAKGWSADEKEMMRDWLVMKARTLPDMCQVYSAPPVLAPWPSYDKLTVQGSRTGAKVAERNIETALEIGVPVGDLVAYESATHKRAEVLAAYAAALAAPAAEGGVEELTAA